MNTALRTLLPAGRRESEREANHRVHIHTLFVEKKQTKQEGVVQSTTHHTI